MVRTCKYSDAMRNWSIFHVWKNCFRLAKRTAYRDGTTFYLIHQDGGWPDSADSGTGFVLYCKQLRAWRWASLSWPALAKLGTQSAAIQAHPVYVKMRIRFSTCRTPKIGKLDLRTSWRNVTRLHFLKMIIVFFTPPLLSCLLVVLIFLHLCNIFLRIYFPFFRYLLYYFVFLLYIGARHFSLFLLTTCSIFQTPLLWFLIIIFFFNVIRAEPLDSTTFIYWKSLFSYRFRI